MEQAKKTPYSQDGYIVDQARLKDIRYGVFTSDINGCGWIAVFNFLKAVGRPVEERAIANELIRYSVLRGLVGTDLFRLKRALRRHGYPTRLIACGNKKARLPEEARAGVIFYCHKDGFHFVTLSRMEPVDPERDEKGEPRCRFFNGIGGKGNHFDTLSGFLSKHNVIPFALILIWPGKRRNPPLESPEAAG